MLKSLLSPAMRIPVAVMILAGALSACSTPQGGAGAGGVHDPYEAQNRRVHAFNRAFDRALFMPDDGRERAEFPPDLAQAIGNFADNSALPGVVVNNLLQGDIKNGAMNSYRFVVNTVLGFGGLADVASEFGIPRQETDFGATLHVWGVPEGAYQELPVLGPSTQRDTAGRVVDMFTNPLSYVLPQSGRYIATGVRVTDKAVDRVRYADTVESVLYDSADSYAQTRTIYLQNRRYELGDDASDAALDPYADPYATADPYAIADPYEDPYAE